MRSDWLNRSPISRELFYKKPGPSSLPRPFIQIKSIKNALLNILEKCYNKLTTRPSQKVLIMYQTNVFEASEHA